MSIVFEVSAYLADSLALSNVGFSDKAFRSIIDAAMDSILEMKNDIVTHLENPNFSGIDSANLKQVFAAAATTFLEAAKTDAESKHIINCLEEARISTERARYFAIRLEENRVALRSKLATITLAMPHIVGCDWRLDYLIKSNTVDRIDEPVYFVNLTLDQNQPPVKFSASLQELQDLHAKVQDATKAVERILHKKTVVDQ